MSSREPPPRPVNPLLRHGETIADRYRVRAALDCRGLTHVFDALDLEKGDPTVVSAMTCPRGIANPVALARDVEALQAISHPHVVRTHASQRLGSHCVCWATARVEGVNLERCNDALGPLAPAQVAALVTGVGRGLDAAYQQGVCHGRLTLRKLILGRLQNGRVGVTIVGFGAALLVQPSTDTTGATSPIDVSTATTVAPEMLTGASIVDQRADVYSLAAIVFELLAGRPVFQDDNAIRLLARKVATDAPRLREVARVPVAPKFEEIVARGLSRDPALRPRSAGELVFELRRSADVGGPSSRALEDCLADTLESMPAEDGGGANTGKFEPV